MRLTVLRPKGAYAPRDYAPLHSLYGEVTAEVPVSPGLLTDLVLRELRETSRQSPVEVLSAIERAGELFATRTLGGQRPGEYCAAVNATSGLPLAVVQSAARELSVGMESMRTIIGVQRPHGLDEPPARSAARTVWIPRGAVLGVIAPSNHPGTHISWLQALALGYKVVVRPGARDPFTPFRLALALLEAGLSPTMLAFLPGNHQTAAQIVERVDCALVYGGEEAIAKLSAGSRARIIRRGPGYSKVIAARDSLVRLEEVARSIVRSASGDAGVKCTNASGVVCDRVDFRELRERVAAELAALTAGPLGDAGAMLPVMAADAARQLHAAVHVRATQAGFTLVGASHDVGVVDFGDGTAALRPLVFESPGVTAAALRFELPVPALWLAQVEDVKTVDDFGETLVMGYIGDNERLRQRLLDDPRIGKLICGTAPTYHSEPQLPHDGYLAHSLMVAKASIGAA
jgi:acyl-CoA reductase-like NAD-dependent aldehyde dehydrogenase